MGDKGDKGAECLISDVGVLGCHVDVSGVHQESEFVRSLLFDLEWEDAYGGSPVLNALLVVVFEYSCPSQGFHFLGGDVRGEGGGDMVVKVKGFWVGCPGGVVSISECSDDIVGGCCGLKKWECMP